MGNFTVNINSWTDPAHHQAAPVAASQQEVRPGDRALSLASRLVRVKLPLISGVHYWYGDEIKSGLSTARLDSVEIFSFQFKKGKKSVIYSVKKNRSFFLFYLILV